MNALRQAGVYVRDRFAGVIRSMLSHVPAWLDLCEASALPRDMKEALNALIAQRARRLTGAEDPAAVGDG